ncbi:hypothetical protein B0H14DRAFT_1534166 [Mycena olivaceomarginata]|nr:hypothetical protein B0H14DRAFT_1534166 [Mycena olivaceomarginata]
MHALVSKTALHSSTWEGVKAELELERKSDKAELELEWEKVEFERESDVEEMRRVRGLRHRRAETSSGSGTWPSRTAAPGSSTPPAPGTTRRPRMQTHHPESFEARKPDGTRPSTARTTTPTARPRTRARGLAVGTAGLHDRVEKLNVDLADGLAGFRAQLQGFQADAAEALAHPPASDIADSHAIPPSSRVPTGSGPMASPWATASGTARITQLQNEVTALQATVGSHNHTLKILLARSSASSGTAALTPFAAIDNGRKIDDGRKRAREQDEDDHPAHRNAPAVFIPPTFSLPTAPPAPNFASPAFAPPASALAIAVAAPALAYAMPTAPIYRAPAPTIVAPVVASPAATLPTAPPTLPRVPPSGPPRIAIDPAREVRLGPMDWEKWHITPRN